MPIDTEEVSHQETIVDLSPHLKLYAGGTFSSETFSTAFYYEGNQRFAYESL